MIVALCLINTMVVYLPEKDVSHHHCGDQGRANFWGDTGRVRQTFVAEPETDGASRFAGFGLSLLQTLSRAVHPWT